MLTQVLVKFQGGTLSISLSNRFVTISSRLAGVAASEAIDWAWAGFWHQTALSSLSIFLSNKLERIIWRLSGRDLGQVIHIA